MIVTIKFIGLFLVAICLISVIMVVPGTIMEESKKKAKEEEWEQAKNNVMQSRRDEIISDYNEMKQESRFQQVMLDLCKIIDANEKNIVCLYFSSGIYIRLQDNNDKWSIEQRRDIVFDISKYKLRFNTASFLYWIMQKYPFFVYHCRLEKGGEQFETRKIENALLNCDRDGDPSNAATIIYRKGVEIKYWMG